MSREVSDCASAQTVARSAGSDEGEADAAEGSEVSLDGPFAGAELVSEFLNGHSGTAAGKHSQQQPKTVNTGEFRHAQP